MKVSITMTQCLTLNDLRGPPERAHMLVMYSIPSEEGAVLEATLPQRLRGTSTAL